MTNIDSWDPTEGTRSTEEKLPVTLFIRGEQYYDDVDPDGVELMTEGTMEVTGDGLRLTYEESELTGMEGTTTTFEVRGPQVILTRAGGVNSQMVFEAGRQLRDMVYFSMELSRGVN